ncbi:hypothetical protein OG735_08810 [Streptomyces sp. NBC_01210]|nr:hypothetical protein OG735_08810 [Streptomyces sp. NBC_01210]
MAALDAWLCFEDEAGFSMTPPTARTWARRGRTPVIRVRGRSQRRFSVAALACYKQGERSRLIYRPKRHVDQIQYRSNLINGCLAETGLTLTTPRQQSQ